MKNTIIIALIGLLSLGTIKAQIQIFKVEQGKETLLQGGEDITIQVDESGRPESNILVRVNQEAFKDNYKYEKLTVIFDEAVKLDESIIASNASKTWLALHHPNVIKRLGDENSLDFYLFDPGTGPVGGYQLNILQETFQRVDEYNGVHKLAILGQYLDSEERYLDENAQWQSRYEYSREEILAKYPSPKITIVFSEALQSKEKYRSLVGEGRGEFEGLKGYKSLNQLLNKQADKLNNRAVSAGIYGGAYRKVASKMLEVRAHYDAKVQSASGQEEAFAVVEAYNKAAKHMIIGKMKYEALGPLAKALKKANDATAIEAIFASKVKAVDLTEY